ncbi:MAG TPA: bifunctional precorrin-2 dehydrogenase/sirohydrochlorin ferrochelatase [Gaiellaceae bacterium]|nr:bifunctional precorrin-2 dehydrogenase/sirohydrochlorin ferrochelatase [Gaiellaceae bacterium]
MAEKRYYPAFLDLEGRSCLVVGGGPAALEKTRGLLACGARVTVVAPRVVDELGALDVELLPRRYRSSDLEGRFLVVAATSDPELNRRVFADAEARALLCNVVDVPELCSFILPAVARRGPIALAVSTGGASPALAQRLRDDLAAAIGPEHVALARRLRALRPWAKATLPTYEERRRFFAALVAEELR